MKGEVERSGPRKSRMRIEREEEDLGCSDSSPQEFGMKLVAELP